MRLTRTGALQAALVTVALAATTGCGGGPDIRLFDGDPPIFTYHGEGGMDAIVDGQLVYLEDEQCIALAHGDQRAVAVFPDGSDAYLEPDGTLIVEVAGNGPIREGVWITGSGGTLSTDLGSARPEIPLGCSTDGTSYAVLQQITDAR